MSPDDEASLNITPMRLAATQLHEMYTELCKAGFKRKEALFLISKLLTSGIDES